jgi:hypothetical protein
MNPYPINLCKGAFLEIAKVVKCFLRGCEESGIVDGGERINV